MNKLDTVKWSKERFDEIVSKLKQFLKQVGFKESDVRYVPCSGKIYSLVYTNSVSESVEETFILFLTVFSKEKYLQQGKENYSRKILLVNV